MKIDKPVYKRLNELLAEANDQIDAILGGQDDPRKAVELSLEIMDIVDIFTAGCWEKYRRLAGDD